MRSVAFAALNLLAVFSAMADEGPVHTNYVFSARGARVGVASPAQANEPRMYLLLCDPGATAETLQAANVPAEVSNWWHVVYCADKSTGDAERDFKRLMDVYDAGVGRGFSPRVFKTVAVTPAGKALERRFLSVPRRPKPEQRSFRSRAVDAKVAEVTAALRATGRDKLALMFENCYPNTIDTTVSYRKGPDGDDETFVYTGDIPAMWLRDSAAQVWPYLRLVKDDDALRRMIRGVVLKQFELIRLDPYANAFNDLPPDEAAKPGRIAAGVQVKKGIWERKYELDSLCYPIRLAHGYWKASGDGSVFDARWLKTLRTILAVMREQQHKTSWKSSYFFACPAVCNNAIENNGWGRQVKPVGLIASSFRPSDDATQLPFLVPSNLMAADVLGKAAEILEAVNREKGLADECRALKAEVEAALARYAVREHPTAGRIYAFEVDGFGSALFMDDANVPSLIAIPYFTDIPKDDPVYRATRAFVWSEENPWFFRGKAGEGIGGPHCGHGSIWPMSVILKGLTTDDPAEMNACLDQLEKTDAGTSFIHESHDKDDASRFSRTWFAWANTLFGELVLKALECGRLADGTVCCERFEPGTRFDFQCWAPQGLADGEGAVYVFLEWGAKAVSPTLERLMRAGAIPPGICVSVNPGTLPRPDRWMRAEEFDQAGTEFPSALAEEIVPAAERLLGVRASRDPNRWFVTGASSGGIAAWNACWYRNDLFRRAYCNSPTFSNMRGGSQLMPLVRKCEARPIRAWLTCGTDEPDYFFGDSYFVAEDAAGALRFAGYDVRFERFPHADHGAKWGDAEYLAKVLTWLFEDWRTKPVAVPAQPIRVRDAIVKDATWRPCAFAMPAPVVTARSSDLGRVYTVSPTNRYVMSARPDGSQRVRLAPLELAWNATRVGGTALAVAADDRVWVATELGVQGVVSFGLADVVLPLPGDLPCDNVALVGTNLYASSGARVFVRPVRVGAADPTKAVRPATPGYADGFWYSRDHEPAGGVGELLGSYVAAGRIAGVVSVLSDADGNEQYDCAGWARNYGRRRCDLMTPDTVFAVFSMTKTFTGAAIMCALDEGKMSLDDEVAKYLPEFAAVKLKNGAKPKRPLTLRDLTSHVTGFRACGGVVDRDLPLREVARRLAKEPLEAEPGETFAYGNAWIDAAAACLEIAVGEPYERYLQRKVLDPLGMKDTTFCPSADQLRRLVAAYTTDDTPIRPAADDCARQLVFPKKAKIFPSASGGLFSTPRDMVRFSQMLAHHGERKGARIISRKTFDTVFAVKQTPPKIKEGYSCGCWIEGDWMGHEGAMRTDQRANLRTGQSRVFFIQTENRAGSAFFQLKRAWNDMTEDNSKEGGAR